MSVDTDTNSTTQACSRYGALDVHLIALMTISICSLLCKGLLFGEYDAELLVFDAQWLGVLHLFLYRISHWCFTLALAFSLIELCVLFTWLRDRVHVIFSVYALIVAFVAFFVQDSIYYHALYANYVGIRELKKLPYEIGIQYLITDALVRYWFLFVILPYCLMEYVKSWNKRRRCEGHRAEGGAEMI